MTFKLGNQAKTWGSAALFLPRHHGAVRRDLHGGRRVWRSFSFRTRRTAPSSKSTERSTEASWWASGSPTRSTWGRAMNPSTSTFTDAEGNDVLWYAPSNLSPAGDEFATAVQDRVEQIRAAHHRDGEQAHPQRPRDELRQRVRSAHLAGCRIPGGPLWRGQPQERVEIRDIIKQCPSSPVRFLGMRA